jgi:hypothetical protein
MKKHTSESITHMHKMNKSDDGCERRERHKAPEGYMRKLCDSLFFLSIPTSEMATKSQSFFGYLQECQDAICIACKGYGREFFFFLKKKEKSIVF